MNPAQREQVRSNAKYLRNVRPIDPDEIHEYVEDQPHPAAVERVLRESAVELGLVERDDGTFVPVDEGAVRVAFDGVDRFPGEYGRVLADLLVERYGAGWPDGSSGDAIRDRIRTVKDAYLRGAAVEYDEETALAYALYHLPGYYAAVQYVLAELVADGLLPRRVRVLDVGAGVGGPALGLCDFLPDDALLDYHAVEPGAGVDVLEAMLAETGRNVHATVHRTTAEAFDPASVGGRNARTGDDGDNLTGNNGDDLTGDSGDAEDVDGFDVVLFANVLSELDDPAAVVREYRDALAPDGTVVALAPADRNTAVGLRAVERAVADRGPYDLYAPDVRLWAGETPSDECWSFDVRPDLAVPAFQRKLADGAGSSDEADSAGETDPAGEAGSVDRAESQTGSPSGTASNEFVNVDVQYAYSLLRRDGRRRDDLSLDASRVARFADSGDHVTNRVDCTAAKLSRDLSSDGNPLYLVSDGSQAVSHFVVHTKETALNRSLAAASYGDVLAFENALVLWNDDEDAYNLVVDGETVVDRVPR